VFRAQGKAHLLGPLLGWSSAIASFGAFIVPSVLAVATAQRTLAEVMLGFAAYYLFCFVLNFSFYLRPDRKGQGCVLPQPCLGTHHLADIVNSRQSADFEKCAICGGAIPTLDGLAEWAEGGRAEGEGLCICKFAEAAGNGVVFRDLSRRQATLMRGVFMDESLRAKVSFTCTNKAGMDTHKHVHDKKLHILPLP